MEHHLSSLLQLHFHSRVNPWLPGIGRRQLQDETRNIKVLWFGEPYIRDFMVHFIFVCVDAIYNTASKIISYLKIHIYHISVKIWWIAFLNILRQRQNGCHFADNIFKCIFFNENVWILIKISLKFDPKGPINNIPALVQIMAWRHPGDKPLSEPMMVNLSTHICVSWPQWVKYIALVTASIAIC